MSLSKASANPLIKEMIHQNILIDTERGAQLRFADFVPLPFEPPLIQLHLEFSSRPQTSYQIWVPFERIGDETED